MKIIDIFVMGGVKLQMQTSCLHKKNKNERVVVLDI
jgi:hypothetical protein